MLGNIHSLFRGVLNPDGSLNDIIGGWGEGFRHAQALLSLSGSHDLIPLLGKLVRHWGSSLQAPKEDTHGGDLQVMVQLYLFLCGGVILFAASGDIKIAEQDGLNTSTQGGKVVVQAYSFISKTLIFHIQDQCRGFHANRSSERGVAFLFPRASSSLHQSWVDRGSFLVFGNRLRSRLGGIHLVDALIPDDHAEDGKDEDGYGFTIHGCVNKSLRSPLVCFRAVKDG